MKYLKKFESYRVNEGIPGGIGAIAGGLHKSKSPTQQDASDEPDEFLCDALVNAMMKKWGSYNCKIKDIKINVAEEKKGFFNKLFSDDTTLEFTLESSMLKTPINMRMKLKKDKFVLMGDAGDNKFLHGYVAEEHQEKFIKYLLGQSKWAKELKESIPDIDKKLTKESFS